MQEDNIVKLIKYDEPKSFNPLFDINEKPVDKVWNSDEFRTWFRNKINVFALEFRIVIS